MAEKACITLSSEYNQIEEWNGAFASLAAFILPQAHGGFKAYYKITEDVI